MSGELASLLSFHGRNELGAMLGHAFGSSMSTFVSLPSSLALSLAFYTFFYTYPDAGTHSLGDCPVLVCDAPSDSPLRSVGGDGTLNALMSEFDLSHHPR